MGRAISYTGRIRHGLKSGLVVLFVVTALVLPCLSSGEACGETPSTCVLRWSTIHTPGSFPERNDIRSPCEINKFVLAGDDKTIYALDVPDSSPGPAIIAGIWKSVDGGISWSSRVTRWLTQASPVPVFPVADIAVAPDDLGFVAAVCMDTPATHRREVYISEDGGVNWAYTGCIPWLYGPNEQIGAITISSTYTYQGNDVHDIIVGSRNPADGLAQGELYVLRYPGMTGWKSQGFTGGDIIDIALSPSYTSDLTIVAMASTTQRTFIHLGSRDLAANTCSWNTWQGWPVEVCAPDQTGGINSGEDRIIAGCLSLPSDFSGSTCEKRIIFASYDSSGLAMGTSQPLDDVYRLNDTVVTRLKVPGYGSNLRIASIAYHGTTQAGKLLTGEASADPATAAATVWVTANPLASCPSWSKPLKAPTGGLGSGWANAYVSWTSDGAAAFCATGAGNRDVPLKWSNPTDPAWNSQALDESAFSISIDGGISWNQLGLIDTCLSRFRAVTVSADGSTLYLSSVNDNGLDSTWRSQSSIAGDLWQRVLTMDCPLPILRLAPDSVNGTCIFTGCQTATRLVSSRDSGQTWQDCLPGITIQDVAARDSNEIYVLQANGLVRHGKYNSEGWLWDRYADTELPLAHMIVAQDNSVLVGAGLGHGYPASYSLDNGNNWLVITEPTPSSGNRHVALDSTFKDNHIIYVADDAGGVYRWVLGSSNRWDDMEPPNNSYYGIAAGKWGILYAPYSPLATGVDRTIYAHSGIPKIGPSWDALSVGLTEGVFFRLEPNALVLADESIWAIDARDYNPTLSIGCLWAFRDTLAEHSPWLIAPKDNSIYGCDPVTGRNVQVDLKWEQLSLADAYEIEIGKDKWLDTLIAAAEPVTNPFYAPADLLYPAYSIPVGSLPEAGCSYYWHVRVRRAATGQIIRSPWSREFSFDIRPGFPVVTPSHPGIQSLQPCHRACQVAVYPVAFSWTPLQTATLYRFVLARDAALSNIMIDDTVAGTSYRYSERLDYRSVYFWQVTPLKPVPGDPSPVFAFTTQDPPPLLEPQSREQGLAWLYALLSINAMAIIFCAAVIVIIDYRHRRSS